MKKLIPLLLPVFGICAGVGAGLYLKKNDLSAPAEMHAATESKPHNTTDGDHSRDAHSTDDHDTSASTPIYVKLNNQFIVPVIESDEVTSIVVLSLSIELKDGNSEAIYAKEPKLRDGFLQVLFDHSNMGGFAGAFTNSGKMATLRRSLLSVARKAVGDGVTDVLITDLARQDV